MRSLSAGIVSPGRPLAAGGGVEPLPAVRFLVDAAADGEMPVRTFYQRTLRVLDLFERVGQRQRGVA